MTEIVICPETPEELLAVQEETLMSLSKEELTRFRRESGEIEEKYWFEETWSMWEKKLSTLPIRRYLFVEKRNGVPEELKKNRYIYFINIAETAKALQKYYGLFREYVGFDFDPLKVVFDAKNPDSPFWKAVWNQEVSDKNVCLIGILFGFGFENSYPFSWQFCRTNNLEESEFISAVLNIGEGTVTSKELKEFNPPKSFWLPAYHSFSGFDPHKEKYKHERNMIQQIYMNADIIECTMQELLR